MGSALELIADMAQAEQRIAELETERDAAREAFDEIDRLVRSLEDAVQHGAGCCGPAIGRGSRLTQIREHIEHVRGGAWQASQRDRLNDAWDERDVAEAHVRTLRDALELINEKASDPWAAMHARAALAATEPKGEP